MSAINGKSPQISVNGFPYMKLSKLFLKSNGSVAFLLTLHTAAFASHA